MYEYSLTNFVLIQSTLMSRATRTEVTAMDVSKKEAGTESLTATKTPPIALQCPYCAKESFSSLAALSLHVQTLHGKRIKDFFFLKLN